MTDSGTDQTTIQYVRPGTWQASAGIPGIDATHSYVKRGVGEPVGPPLGMPRGEPSPPDGPTAELSTVGPSAGGISPPPQNDGKWWKRRNASRVHADQVANGPDWNVTLDDAPPVDVRARDPRQTPVPENRITQMMGPMNLAYLNREPTARDMRHASRFVDPGGRSFAYTPSLRPSPASLGDGIGFQRFRTTLRVSPAPLDQTIVSKDQSDTSTGSVLGVGSQLMQRWW